MKITDWFAPQIAATAVLAAKAVTDVAVPNATVAYFGVPLSTVGMAFAGSLIAFAYGTPVESRGRLFGYAIGGAFIGIWGVQVLPAMFGWEWYSPQIEPPVAGIIALLSRWIVPFVIENVPEIGRRVMNSRAGKDGAP